MTPTHDLAKQLVDLTAINASLEETNNRLRRRLRAEMELKDELLAACKGVLKSLSTYYTTRTLWHLSTARRARDIIAQVEEVGE